MKLYTGASLICLCQKMSLRNWKVAIQRKQLIPFWMQSKTLNKIKKYKSLYFNRQELAKEGTTKK